MNIAEFYEESKDKVPKNLKFFIVSTSKDINDYKNHTQAMWAENAEDAFKVLSENGRIKSEIEYYYIFEILGHDENTKLVVNIDTFQNLACSVSTN